jgi:phosphate transport system permease protein
MLTQQSDLPRAGGPEVPVRPPSDPSHRVARRRFLDRLARGVVTLGGTAVILSILAILAVIVKQILPLFSRADVARAASVSLASLSAPMAVGSDEYRENLWAVSAGGVSFYSAKDGARLPVKADLNIGPVAVTAPTLLHQGSMVLGLADGRAIRARLLFATEWVDGKRRVTPRFAADPAVTLDPSGRPIRKIAEAATGQGTLLAAALGPREVSLLQLRKKKSLMGDGKVEEIHRPLALTLEGDVTALAMDGRGEDLFLGLDNGQIVRVDLRDPAAAKATPPVLAAAKTGTAITALLLLNGDRTLAVGDAAGRVSTWQVLRSEEGNYFVTRINDFDPHPAAIAQFARSLRDKGFASLDTAGAIRLHYATTGSTLAKVPAPAEPPRALAITPRSDSLIAVSESGRLNRWDVSNPHPESTLKSLFGQIWYEGYPEPEFVWQSTGGTDDFESKFSLVPLIYGTLKGTFYAMIISVPLALLSALYVSQFMHPALKQNIKPVIEVMAALPSVVLGFIAALWLAPIVERRIPALFIMAFVQTVLILVAVAGWRATPLSFRQRFRHGTEVGLLVPVVVIGTIVSFWLGGILESTFLGGDTQAWLLKKLDLSFDQRNSVVVGLAMGFAVIPIIFTIAEDSLSNVPPYLAAGSLALGATRWQTALKVVLPTASPGIFSAVMIGFGRAAGETMIVLMATGNTAIMNLNPFKGFRALSANIAVEFPDAAVDSTHFRVLFLAAFLLFLMTFAVNTAAEMVRLRLRKRFQSL